MAQSDSNKIWIFPDIHGYIKTLEELFLQIQPSKEEHLIFLGDYIDRGPDSKGVIDFIMDLQAKKYHVTALKGNHEEFFVEAYKEDFKIKRGLFGKGNQKKKKWFEYGGKETMKSFGTKDLRKIPEKYIEWIDKLPLYYETPNYVIVHAGLNFKIENPFDDKHAMLWIKEFEIDQKKINGKKVIHGHTPVSHKFIQDTITSNRFDFIDLDNGVYMEKMSGFGKLMALELNSMLLLAQPAVDNTK